MAQVWAGCPPVLHHLEEVRLCSTGRNAMIDRKSFLLIIGMQKKGPVHRTHGERAMTRGR